MMLVPVNFLLLDILLCSCCYLRLRKNSWLLWHGKRFQYVETIFWVHLFFGVHIRYFAIVCLLHIPRCMQTKISSTLIITWCYQTAIPGLSWNFKLWPFQIPITCSVVWHCCHHLLVSEMFPTCVAIVCSTYSESKGIRDWWWGSSIVTGAQQEIKRIISTKVKSKDEQIVSAVLLIGFNLISLHYHSTPKTQPKMQEPKIKGLQGKSKRKTRPRSQYILFNLKYSTKSDFY
jgi:hypothetical protein